MEQQIVFIAHVVPALNADAITNYFAYFRQRNDVVQDIKTGNMGISRAMVHFSFIPKLFVRTYSNRTAFIGPVELVAATFKSH